MGGYIKKTEIIKHPITVIRAFGFRVFVACLMAKGNMTFLTILTKFGRI